MTWIDKVRQKPQEQKIRLIWFTVIITAVILILAWIILARFGRALPKDSSLINTIGQGIHDVKDNYNK